MGAAAGLDVLGSLPLVKRMQVALFLHCKKPPVSIEDGCRHCAAYRRWGGGGSVYSLPFWKPMRIVNAASLCVCNM